MLLLLFSFTLIFFAGKIFNLLPKDENFPASFSYCMLNFGLFSQGVCYAYLEETTAHNQHVNKRREKTRERDNFFSTAAQKTMKMMIMTMMRKRKNRSYVFWRGKLLQLILETEIQRRILLLSRKSPRCKLRI